MSDAARLARLAFSKKPGGTPYSKFKLNQSVLNNIEGCRGAAAGDAAYASAVSYVEALAGLQAGSTSWAVIRLYYSSFYSIKALLLLSGVIPFNGGAEMLLELPAGLFIKGGRSSHHWNWNSVRRTAAKSGWFASQDSEETYQKLREHRENVNYTHGFRDPELHPSLISFESDVSKRFRAYRDDTSFVYTYLSDHSMIAYPTRLLFEVELQIKSSAITVSQERIDHLSSIWKLRDRCPLT